LACRHVGVDWGVAGYELELSRGARTVYLQQAELAGAGHRLGAPLHLQLLVDPAVVPFDRVQSEDEALADVAVREPLANQPQDFELALAQ
jgi:hypothetical protein